MVKCAAEKMREYRNRMKEDPDKYQDYLTKAKKRKRQNYKDVSRLTRKEKSERRENTKEYVKRHRIKKKLEAVHNIQEEPMISETSRYETNTPDSTGPLIVNFAFPNRRNGPRKRISRALAKKYRQCNDLKTKFGELQKKYKRTVRNLQRYKKKVRQPRKHEHISSETDLSATNSRETPRSTPSVSGHVDNETIECTTPRSKTKEMLRKAGLNKTQSAKIRKQLLLANVVETHVKKQRCGIKQNELGALRGLIGGKILSKYRLAKTVNKSTGLGRNRIANISNLGLGVNNFRRKREVERYRTQVLAFMMRDDNSRCNPGKRDKVNGEMHQTRVLTDYLKNLYLKFLSENTGVKLSLTSFCRIRPAYIRLTRLISRNSCLCIKHQNFALCTQALRKSGVNIPLNPERFVEEDAHAVKMQSETPAEITFGQWKRVQVQDKGKTRMMMKVTACTMQKNEFLEHMEKQSKEFKDHVYRVYRQYGQSLKLKETLPKDEVIVVMDFAENYACKSVEEIKSAYWNQSAVTLHPVVYYFKENNDELKHQSVVIVSNEMGHNSNTGLTFMDKIVPEIKKTVPDVRKLHYFTDSPTSQYKNKTMFHSVANYEQIYGCKAVWNFFEAGHGKGPCDGLGGTTKRMADDAMKTGKVTIQDAEEFFHWTQSRNCTMKNVQFMYVSSSDCQEKTTEVNMYDVKPIKGTMKIHAVIGKGNNTLLTSTVSCYCPECVSGQECGENHWIRETLLVSNKSSTSTEERQVSTEYPESNTTAPPEDIHESPMLNVSVGSFVAAMYDSKVYVGKILHYDDGDGEVEITFMQNVRKLLQWPKQEDRIWVE